VRRRDFSSLVGIAAVTWPLAAFAQQKAMPVIGFLSGWSSGDSVEYLEYYRRGLAEGGYREGQNVEIEFRYAEGHFDRLPELAADLVKRRVDVIAIPNTTASAFAAKSATQTIPIVFSLGSNPVEVGLVASLNHPGGNLTGLTALQTAVTAKRVEMVHELLPKTTRIAFLTNPANSALAAADTREARETARRIGLDLLVLNASNPGEIDAAFATLVREEAGALLTNSESYFMIQRNHLGSLAFRYAVPTMYAYRENAVAGGLMSYGSNFLNATRTLGLYTGRILNGEKPADLPVQQATDIELVINLKTAKTLGITVPQSLLQRADEVIQ
jgi:putative tryptophan/tyrosine transport system substrate-binding protein